mmetsp:Transcript_31034/g.47067  ORF Transcript_31034/g.47067 Transcript_31034/m.47067 type:complete len:94 (+) Transcript_31034:1110-1391(+)
MFPNNFFLYEKKKERSLQMKCVMKFHLPKFFRFPYSVGKVETKSLLNIAKVSKSGNSPYSVGSVPSMPLKAILNVDKKFKSASSGGKVPLKEF